MDFVKTEYIEFAELILESGEKLGPVKVAYETYGTLNADKSNAILVFHALSGDAHAAGKHSADEKKSGWWDGLIGEGKAFDASKYFVICANVLGGCSGTTGPSSINPGTGKPYGQDFPLITIKDMVNCQIPLLDHMGIHSLLATTGGSMGGMLALQLAGSYPDRVRNVIPIATSARVSAQNIAFNEVGRRAILADPKTPPNDGLAIARMIGHITYLSDEAMRRKFGRKEKGEKSFTTKFGDPQFEVESYLQHQGLAFIERFDAHSYLYITKAIDRFDLSVEGNGSLKDALAKCKSRFLVIHFNSDWLFPEYQALEIVDALKDNSANVSYRVIDADFGHDSFLIEVEEQTKAIASFLAGSNSI
ncbi:MAG: homoserine O-acetyltransferase [Candidatus Margulisbacteria bacterium]|nr:homoserine O-acetyltransferase [Candidatus Margulisiibacteriota bacterium]